MLYVKAEVRASKIHNLGLFAAESIQRGAVVFLWNRKFGAMYSETEYEALPSIAQNFLRRYGWRFRPPTNHSFLLWLLDYDDSRFINHAPKPNLIVTTAGFPFRSGERIIESRAARDIAAGEELTEDYSSFDIDFDSYKHELTRDCPDCDGVGSIDIERGGSWMTCSTCNGTKKISLEAQ